jgi:hypothetical protein
MPTRAKVAVLKTRPETVLEDYVRLMKLADLEQHLDPTKTTILKDNISWHFPFPAANTTPWQMEGVVQGLQGAGYQDLTCVQNKTVVTNAFKGEDLNNYVPIFKKYQIPVLYNFKDEDMTWVKYEPKHRMLVLLWQEHCAFANDEMPHLHHNHRRDQKRLWRAAQHQAPLYA